MALRRAGSNLWAPAPENKPQNEAFDSLADETLYGGSAGGGKSDLLIGLGLTRHQKTVIFRKQQNDAKALIDRAKEIVGADRWNASSHAIMTEDGREIEFGHCSRPGSEKSWQGRPHDAKEFDELTQFSEHEYLFLSAWNRTTDPHQRTRIVAASNPPLTAEGFWVVKRWAPWLSSQHPHPAKSGELRWFATIDGKDTEVDGPEPFKHERPDGGIEVIKPRSRTFIRAKLSDNPYYRNTAYESVLQGLPEPLRSALLYGEFGAAMEDDPWQVIPTAWVVAAMARWKPKPPGPMSTMGVDPARGGKAAMTCAARHGDWFAEITSIPGKDVPTGIEAAGRVVQEVRDGACIQVDVIGIGAACYEHLDQIGLVVAPMDARAASTGTDRSGQLRMFNKRSEWWWAMREALDPKGGDNISLPPDEELKADLCAPKWKLTRTGIQVEPKEDIEDRLGRTVDKGDAVVMALPQEMPPLKDRSSVMSTPEAETEYDPHRY